MASVQAKSNGSHPPRRVSILGATGSIGASTVDLLRRGEYEVEALTANSNAAALAQLARDLNARFAAVADPSHYQALKDALAGSGIEAGAGPAAVVEAATRPADWVMAAISGASGLAPTLAAVAQGRTVALANKECLVCAGSLFMRAAATAGVTLLPVDSEHNAVFQALAAGGRDDVRRVILTASGGPFRTWSKEALRHVTLEQALKHPNWSMGQKITIDSATMMNKGLEVIEAHHLFQVPASEIEVLVHPQSVVHGLVEFCDGSMIAAMAAPDMRVPIAHCLAWPERLDGPAPRLDLAKVATLTFEEPDDERFPALALARRALAMGQGAPTLLNAANEIAVAEFLDRRIAFLGIPALVEATLEQGARRGLVEEPQSLDDALSIDHDGRALARTLLPEIAAKTF
ncbi:MAG TPA: 1-deoxy-D-xylulose-5-phosphate reductoisomerase [Xanthobacteraceae bacterium]|jgi:1-deoxy-D-xylulose-5-phosphate reductoisomerase